MLHRLLWPAYSSRVSGRRTRLARARKTAGLTQEELAYRVGVDRSTIGRWEAGETDPQPWLRPKLTRCLGITPARLDALLAADEEDPPEDVDAFDRLTAAIGRSHRVDDAVVEHLAGVLAQQRKAEDVIGPRHVLVPVLAELNLIERLARDARGPVRQKLVRLAAEYRQFAGWMGEDTDDHAAALVHYARAMDAAQEVGDHNMVTSVLSMKSHLAWSERDPARAIGLAAAGRRAGGKVSPGVRALIAQQEARGHALEGNSRAVDELLDLTEQLTATAAEHPEDEPPWVYFNSPVRVLFQRGVAYVELRHHSEAVELFEAARMCLAPGYRRDIGRYSANLAIAAALDGQLERAVTAGREALRIAVEVGSAHTVADLRRMRRALDRWANSPAVADFDAALAEVNGATGVERRDRGQ
jgi:transcriptional regulator with XRE-family HTH domain